MNKYDDDCPCVGCEYECDDWEARYCCDLYQWLRRTLSLYRWGDSSLLKGDD